MWAADTEHLYGVRVDTGVDEGGEIPMYYDSMIAKLIVHGTDRNDAIAKMREALNGFVIRGISSNIPFQAALLAHPKFVAGDFNTGFIAEHYAEGFQAEDVPHDDPDFLVALAAYVQPARAAARRRHQRPAARARVQGRRGLRRGQARCRRASTRSSRRTVQRLPGAVRLQRGRDQRQALRDLQQLAPGRRAHPRHRRRQGLHRAGRARRGQEPAGAAHRRTTARGSTPWC